MKDFFTQPSRNSFSTGEQRESAKIELSYAEEFLILMDAIHKVTQIVRATNTFNDSL